LFPGTSTVKLCLEIAKEEADLAETGADQPHDMMPVLLIQNGLDLEEQQYVLMTCSFTSLTITRWVLMQLASEAHTPNECAKLEE